jgi:hypothetical protein
VKDDKGDWFPDSHGILARCRNYFSRLLNVHGINDVRQTEIHTAEPLMPEPSASEFELATEKLKSHKSPGIDQTPAKFTKTLRCDFHELIISIWNKEELSEEWKKSIVVRIYKKGDKIVCSNYRGISFLSTTYKILFNILLSKIPQYAEEIIGDYQSGFRSSSSTTDRKYCIR